MGKKKGPNENHMKALLGQIKKEDNEVRAKSIHWDEEEGEDEEGHSDEQDDLMPNQFNYFKSNVKKTYDVFTKKWRE